MSKQGPNWRRHEAQLQEALGLSATSGSGNKWHDISDGVKRGHPSKVPFPVMIDCKATEAKSYSLKRDFFLDWIKKAGFDGKKFFMPIRFEENEKILLDIVAVPLDIFVPMMQAYIKSIEQIESVQFAQESADFIARLISTIEKPDLKQKAVKSLDALRPN